MGVSFALVLCTSILGVELNPLLNANSELRVMRDGDDGEDGRGGSKTGTSVTEPGDYICITFNINAMNKKPLLRERAVSTKNI
ncbi:hypothetical protein QTP88_002372 [Uroleucon formosanum]